MPHVIDRLSTFHKEERGATAVIFAIVLMALLTGAGVAVDYGRMAHLQSTMQTAMDAAVLAAVRLEESQRVGAATQVFNENLKADNPPPISLSFVSKSATEMSGTASAKLAATLLGAVGFRSFDIGVEATADVDGSGRVCILVLDAAAPQALLVNSGATVKAPDCEIHVRSQAAPAAIFNASSDIDSKRLCVAGSSIIDNGGSHPNLVTSCDTANDPYAGVFPEPDSSTCDETNRNYNGGVINLKPGVYCGWTNFNSQPQVKFDPGVYVIKDGGWNVNGGDWTGSGVVFYFADQSKIQFNSAVAATLTPPTSGSYKDVIIFEKEGLAPSPFVMDDSRGFDLKGIIHLPSRDVILNSSSNAEVRDLAMVVKTLILDDTNWQLTSTATDISASGGPKSVRLVN